MCRFLSTPVIGLNMKLKKYLTINSPFKTNEDIDKLFVFIRSRNICFNEEIKDRLFESCEETAKQYLQKIIGIYLPKKNL